MDKGCFCNAHFSGSALYESTTTSPGSEAILLNNMNCDGSEISVLIFLVVSVELQGSYFEVQLKMHSSQSG